MLQDAHAGELAAALAYRGHWRSLERRRPAEAAEIRRIEGAEWHHRSQVAVLLVELGSGPRRRRELLMRTIGRFFGALCWMGGWFGPMYAAGRLEAANVGQYAAGRDDAQALGLASAAQRMELMRLEEVRHEEWFGDRCRGHWLLPLARVVGRWGPPPLPVATAAARAGGG